MVKEGNYRQRRIFIKLIYEYSLLGITFKKLNFSILQVLNNHSNMPIITTHPNKLSIQVLLYSIFILAFRFEANFFGTYRVEFDEALLDVK